MILLSMRPEENGLWQFVQKKREGRKRRLEERTDLGGEYKCMPDVEKRSKHAKILGTCRGLDRMYGERERLQWKLEASGAACTLEVMI